jgi:membrane associated rhomboid family serine protease
MLFIPYRVETLTTRTPWANIAIIAVTIVVSVMAFSDTLSEDTILSMVLTGWNPDGLLGHMLLHGGWVHLIGNMLMLYIFGNAVCGVMNQAAYVLLYITSGVAAGAVHVLLDGSPALGASGAVAGIMGVYLAVYPVNRVACFWFWLVRTGRLEIPGWALIGGYFILDLFGALTGGAQVAYWAHVGGTVAGFGVGLALLKWRVITIGDYDNPTALDYFSGRK